MENERYSIDERDSHGPGSQYPVSKKRHSRDIMSIVAIAAVVGVWMLVQVNHIREEYKEREAAVLQKSRKKIDERSKHFLKLIAKAHAITVQNGIVHNKLQQTEHFGTEMARQKGFISLMAIDRNGKIISSTNKKLKSRDFVSVGHPFYLGADSTIVNTISDSLWIIASPVGSSERRLGTIIINFNLNKSKIN